MDNLNFDFQTVDWKVVFAAITFLLALIALLYFQWWRNRKRFSYEVLSNDSLISTREDIQKEVKILYKSKSVKNVRLVVIKLINDGFLPIKKDEFDNHVRITFPEGTVLSAEKVKFFPTNLDTSIRHGDNWVEIDPALFNRSDYVQLKILVSSNLPLFEVTARIVGVSQIGKHRKGARFPVYIFLITGALLALVFIFTSPSKEGMSILSKLLVWGIMTGIFTFALNDIKNMSISLFKKSPHLDD